MPVRRFTAACLRRPRRGARARSLPRRAASAAGPEISSAKIVLPSMRTDEAGESQRPAVERRVRGDRRAAARAEARRECTLGVEREARFGMLERSHQLEDVRAFRAALDADDTLADGRQHFLRRDARADARLESEPLEARGREHGRVAIAPVELAEARVDVAAHDDDLEVRPPVTQLALASRARGADARTAWQGRERGVPGRHEGVARVAALQRGRDRESGRQLARHVLHRVDGEVRDAFLHRVLELLDEQALAAHRGEAAVQDAVTLGDDRDEAHHQARVQRRRGAPQRARPARGRAGSCAWRCEGWRASSHSAMRASGTIRGRLCRERPRDVRGQAAAHGERAAAPQPDDLVAFGVAFDALDVGDRGERVAVHAHEASRELLLERLQRFLDQLLAAGVPQRRVLLLGDEAEDVLDRDQLELVARADGDPACADPLRLRRCA